MTFEEELRLRERIRVERGKNLRLAALDRAIQVCGSRAYYETEKSDQILKMAAEFFDFLQKGA